MTATAKAQLFVSDLMKEILKAQLFVSDLMKEILKVQPNVSDLMKEILKVQPNVSDLMKVLDHLKETEMETEKEKEMETEKEKEMETEKEMEMVMVWKFYQMKGPRIVLDQRVAKAQASPCRELRPEDSSSRRQGSRGLLLVRR